MSFPSLGPLKHVRSERIGQRQILPTAVKSKSFGNIITSKPGDKVGNADGLSFTFGNGDQALVTFTLETENNTKLFATLDVSVYVGSQATANQLPGGSAVNETNFQFIGPFYDWHTTDNKNVKVKLYILNISAGSVTIVVRSVWRYIANDPTAEVTTL